MRRRNVRRSSSSSHKQSCSLPNKREIGAPSKNVCQLVCRRNKTSCMDWNAVRRLWEKWSSHNIGSIGQPLKAALLLNYDPTGPSRLVSTIAEKEGIKADPSEISQFLSYVNRNKLPKETFFIAQHEYLVISIHENWFSARCLNTSKHCGEGAIVMQTSAFLIVGLYEGSLGSASQAVMAVDQLAAQLSRRNL